jgi:hypothetical protein
MPRNPTVERRIAWHLEHQKQCACRPIPPQLQEQMRSNAKNSLRSLLSGGDRRSVAGSERAREVVQAEPRHVSELASLAEDGDWLVSMRAMDLLEKLAHEHPDWVQPHKRAIEGFERSGSKALQTRARHIRARVGV